MTAQIRPNRMEVSDRFPMLGFAVRTDEPNVEAEVVLANDIGLFGGQNRARRTAANFYSSREHGTLTVPRGEGVFVVPPDVLARFIGSEKIYFGLATGHGGNGGLNVDAVPRDGSPYVSLRGFTGRTLRRSFGGTRSSSTPRLEWTGDAPKPGSEGANSTAPKATNGAGGASAAPPASGHYDDGFGPLPAIPAKESSYRPRNAPAQTKAVGITMGAGTTAASALDWIRTKIEQGVQGAGSHVDPPSMYYLGDNSSTFIRAWQIAFGVTALFAPTNAFLAAIPTLAAKSNVTLSVGPVLDTPLFGGGVGAVFAPDGQVALFGGGEVSADFDSLLEFAKSLKLALTAKIKLGYNRGGLAKFADIGTVASVNIGDEIAGGAEIWLDSSGSGIGGAVSIGVGFDLQLGVDQPPAGRVGLMMSSGTTAASALEWIRTKIEQGVQAAGSHVDPPSLYYLGDNSSTFVSAWQAAFGVTALLVPTNAFLAAIPSLAAKANVTLSIGPVLDTPLFGGGVGAVFAPDGQVALFGTGEISADFAGLLEFAKSLKLALTAKMKLGYNRGGLAKFADIGTVAGVSVGDEIAGGAEVWLDSTGSGIGGAVSIGVGFALQLAEQEAVGNTATPAYVPPLLPSDPRQRANRIGGGFGQRIGEALDLGLDASTISPLLDRLDASLTPKPLSFSRGLGADPWSINWDGVDVFGQPNNTACWATAAALLIGWRDSKSILPQAIADRCSLPLTQGLDPSMVQGLANSLGLVAAPAACYTPDGFFNLLTHGPLWVGKMMGGNTGNAGHVVLVVGMYFDGSDHYLRIVDPWDRPVGTPGAPANYPTTHVTGSRYIMRYEDFQAEYEMVPTLAPGTTVLILYLRDLGGRVPGMTTPPAGYAMGAARAGLATRVPTSALLGEGGASPADWIQAGTAVIDTVNSLSTTDITFEVEKYEGWNRPQQIDPQSKLNATDVSTAVISWDDGGILDATGLKLNVTWEHDGWSVGNAMIEPFGHNDASGDKLLVKAKFRKTSRKFFGRMDRPESVQKYANNPGAILELRVTYQRERMVRNDVTKGLQIDLYPDGTYGQAEINLD